MAKKLNVTNNGDLNVWTGYDVSFDGKAYPLYKGTLDECRAYAGRNGYDGVLVGSPSKGWVA